MTAAASHQRVLVCAANFAGAQSALAIADRLVQLFGMDIGGLFPEDFAALDKVVSPGQRIVTATGTLLVAPSRGQLEQVFSGEARAFQGALSRLAERHTLTWSFERRSGEMMESLCQAARGWDILLIGQRRLRDRSGPVLNVGSAGQDSDQNHDLTARLARALGTYVTDLTAATETAEDRQAILARVSRMHGALVVTDATHGPFRSEEELRQLIDAARCPVLVTGASGLHSALEHSTQIPPEP